jgi:hypothetical protein
MPQVGQAHVAKRARAAAQFGRTGDRPPKLAGDDIEAAKAMLANPDIGVTQIAYRSASLPRRSIALFPLREPLIFPAFEKRRLYSQAADLGCPVYSSDLAAAVLKPCGAVSYCIDTCTPSRSILVSSAYHLPSSWMETVFSNGRRL